VDERVVHQPRIGCFAEEIDQGEGYDPILLASAISPIDVETMQPFLVKMVDSGNGKLRPLDGDWTGG
jgi:hypothetical protein